MVLVCVKKGYRQLTGDNVSFSLAVEALASDNGGGCVMRSMSQPAALAVAA